MGRHGVDTVLPTAEEAVKAIREEYGVQKLGGVGYCLGAKYVCRFMADGKGIDAGYFAHPTAVSTEELTAVAGPLTIAAGGMFELNWGWLQTPERKLIGSRKGRAFPTTQTP